MLKIIILSFIVCFFGSPLYAAETEAVTDKGQVIRYTDVVARSTDVFIFWANSTNTELVTIGLIVDLKQSIITLKYWLSLKNMNVTRPGIWTADQETVYQKSFVNTWSLMNRIDNLMGRADR